MGFPVPHARARRPRPLHAVLATATALLLASGCAPVLHTDPLAASRPTTSCAPSARSAVAADVSPALVPGLSVDSQSDETSFVHAATPVIPGAPALDQALRTQVSATLTGYLAGRAAAGGVGELNSGWTLVGVSARALGVRLRTRVTVGAETTEAVSVSWLDQPTQRLLQPRDLFTGPGWAELTARLTTDLCSGAGVRSDLVTDALSPDPRLTRLAVAFAVDGSAVVTISPRAAGAVPFALVVPGSDVAPLLSENGLAARESGTHPVSLPPVAPPEPVGPPVPTPEPNPPVTQPVAPKPPPPKKAPPKKTQPKKAQPKKTQPKKAQPKKAQLKKAQPKKARTVDCRRLRCVALTFDDGPGPYTAGLVTVLTKAKAPATFFMIGQQVEAFPGVAGQVARAGMEIGNHSYDHPDLTRQSGAAAKRELTRTSDAIRRATGHRPSLLRPPYGARNAAVDHLASTTGLTEVLWDVDTLDWKHRNAKTVRRAVTKQTRRGSIVLMHDIHPTTVQAVPGIIADLRKQGYTLVTVSQLLGRTQPGSRHFRAG